MNKFKILRAVVILFFAICQGLANSFVAAAAGDDAKPDADAGTEMDFFERNVRPLLAEKCYSCHGRGQRKGMLSLDGRDGVMAGGESGMVVVEGKPEESLLIEAVEYSGAMQMPPDAKLSDREIAILRRWIAQGVPWPEEKSAAKSAMRSAGSVTEEDRQFWSFRAIRQPELPPVKHTEWPKQPLDYFILSRLEAEELQPVAEADRRTYVRRASFDLLGLPPSPAEIAEFVGDERSDAYERLIERLLESPQYGERWSRHWLDVARYGEDQAHTFQARRYPSGYRYRDWVIDSFNRDLPIDQFLMQQIASDLMAGEDRKQRLAALGYFSLGPVYYADAGCAPKAKADEYDDRIDTLTRGILGLTVSCARCHDHKFDPISTKDYYALAGVFSSTEYVEEPLAPAEEVKAYDDAQAAIKEAEQRLKEAEAESPRRAGESLASHTAEYLVMAWLVMNRRKAEAAYQVTAAVEGTKLLEFVVERWLQVLKSDWLKSTPVFEKWFELVAAQDVSRDLSSDTSAKEVIERAASEIQSQLQAAIAVRRDAEAEHRAKRDSQNQEGKKAKKPTLPDDVSKLLSVVVDNGEAPFAIPKERTEKLLPEEWKQELAAMKKSLEEQKKAAPAKYPIVHSLTEGKPANQKIHVRGSVSELGEEVPRRFIEVLSSVEAKPFEQGSGRLELATAIVSPENPLTARVFVNRVWQHHFGRGIVSTPSNFGLLGVPPTHPELLDYLASRFIATGWSLKQLHRDIMLSATYRLASTGSDINQQRDPDNRWLWRMNRRRLDIEAWRDSTLMAAGRLDLTVGGPSNNLADKNNHRRTLYAAVSRHELNPVLRLFDFPDPNLTSERRSMTTVPMQQLFVLNSDFMIDQARAVALRVEQAELAEAEAKVDELYRSIFGREPGYRERQLGVEFLQNNPANVAEANGTAGNVPKLSRLEQYAQALLSTNEFFFVD